MTASATIIGVLVVYLVILLIIGYWGGKESKDVKGYYVAGKKLPAWVIAFSTNTTGESAWLILGLTGMGYLIGAHAFWVILGEVMGVTLSWVLVARPFKEYTDRYDSITVPDYLESRFHDKTHVLRILSALIIFSMAAFYIAAQITASGKAFESFVGTSYETGAIIGAAIILYYTTVGGFKAVAYSDLLQGVLMVGCLFILPIVGISAAGGWTEMMSSLNSIDPDLLQPMGEHGMSGLGIASAVGFVAIGFAFLGSPQLLIRFISAKNTNSITNASMISIFCAIIFDIGAIFSGMAGRVLFPLLEDPETIYPLMSTELFPAAFTGIFLVVVLAAIMSTADSLLILASSAVVRDVIQKVFKPGWSDNTFSHWGKGVTVALGAIALALALPEVRVIFWFVLFAWSGLACFTPVILCSLFWKDTTLAGAIAGLSAGFGTTVLWVLVLKEHFYDLYEMIPGFAMGFLVTIIVSLFTKKPEGAHDEFHSVHKAVGLPFKKAEK
ncbi:MAG: sodium/proline symporter [Gammaproteobacteria bacterium]|jgi:sodium/proline symporter